MADDRSKLLEAAIAQIEKSYGKGSIMRLGSRDVLVPVSVIPSGCLSIDAALGVGGFPRGRVIEIYGPASGGKTTMTLHVLAEAQKLSGPAAVTHSAPSTRPGYRPPLGGAVDTAPVSAPGIVSGVHRGTAAEQRGEYELASKAKHAAAHHRNTDDSRRLGVQFLGTLIGSDGGVGKLGWILH